MPDTPSILLPFNGKPPIAERLAQSPVPTPPDDIDIVNVWGKRTHVFTGPIELSDEAAALIVEGVVRRWMMSVCAAVAFTHNGTMEIYFDDGEDWESQTFTQAAHRVADREGW